ncbi:MAG TPA: hypothetical protein VE175_09200, partial [Woeseiaceae bacterium]|nr:hypothetical protein [Woeseiaceae bacterium]
MFLSDHPNIDTCSIDEARKKLNLKDIGLDSPTRTNEGGFYARLYCAQYPELHFASTVFHSDTTLAMYEGRGEFAVMVPFRGGFRADCGRTAVFPREGQLVVFS